MTFDVFSRLARAGALPKLGGSCVDLRSVIGHFRSGCFLGKILRDTPLSTPPGWGGIRVGLASGGRHFLGARRGVQIPDERMGIGHAPQTCGSAGGGAVSSRRLYAPARPRGARPALAAPTPAPDRDMTPHAPSYGKLELVYGAYR